MHRITIFSCFFFLLFIGISQAQDIPREGEIIPSGCTDRFLLNSGKLVYRAETYQGLEELDEGRADRAYTIFIEQGLNGDLNALALAAMLCKAEEASPSRRTQRGSDKGTQSAPVCPVPAQFWEDSLISLLGEGEGNFILGLFGMELVEKDPFDRIDAYRSPVSDHSLRSARIGHPNGIALIFLIDGLLTEDSDEQFIPPPFARYPGVPRKI